jgi:predicted phosphoribosyltransferase
MWQDRWEAGRLLAAQLAHRVEPPAVALGIARGGVVIAAAIAAEIGVPLAAIVAKKITPPGHGEFAIGAVAGDGPPVLAPWADRWSQPVVAEAIRQARARVTELTVRLGPMPPVADRHVILCDDGIATGMTVLAAARAVRLHGCRRLTIASPVISKEAANMLAAESDDVLWLAMPDPFLAVGMAYADFRPVETQEVRALLERAIPRAS